MAKRHADKNFKNRTLWLMSCAVFYNSPFFWMNGALNPPEITQPIRTTA
jgi:hypothetical protein